MRPISSSYDRQSAQGERLVRPIVERLKAGEVVTYEEIDTAADDASWAYYLRGNVVEVPGVGYRWGDPGEV